MINANFKSSFLKIFWLFPQDNDIPDVAGWPTLVEVQQAQEAIHFSNVSVVNYT